MKVFSPRKLSQATLSGLLVALFVLIMGSTPGLATLYDSVWNNTTGDGLWNTAANWSSGVVPNNDQFGNTHNVFIDNKALNTSTVNLNTSPNINNLTVDAGDTLNINAATVATRIITVVGPGAGGQGVITNNGAINLTTSGSSTAEIRGLSNAGDLLLTGSGIITLGTANSRISFQSGARTITNDTDHTIQGGGYIGVNGYSFINKGTVIANNNKNMIISMTTGSVPGLNNQGTLKVEPGSTLTIQGNFSNYSSSTSTLTGGTYEVSKPSGFSPGGMTLPMTLSQNITHNAATVILDGFYASILRSGGGDAFTNLAQNDAGGSFTIKNGKKFTTAGAFTNYGSLTVGKDSTFTVSGNYTQASHLNLDILNTSQYGVLDVTGMANLGGELNVTLLPGFTFNSGDSFDLIHYLSRSGVFSTINLPDPDGPGGPLFFTYEYGDSGFYITASNQVPLPGSVLLLGSGLLGLVGLRRKFKK